MKALLFENPIRKLLCVLVQVPVFICAENVQRLLVPPACIPLLLSRLLLPTQMLPVKLCVTPAGKMEACMMKPEVKKKPKPVRIPANKLSVLSSNFYTA